MAALERYFLSRGCRVAGYDRTPSELTEALQREGVTITFVDDPATIPAPFLSVEDTLVVYTPAVPESSKLLTFFRGKGYEVIKRAALLGIITRMSQSLCFAGTHGKTTTSSMAAHLLHRSPEGCNAFLGGVLRPYNTNFILDPHSQYSVIEADEYDRSFHHLRPYVAVVTATDPDHLDIYGTEEAYLESFSRFTELIHPEGCLLMHTGLKFTPRVAPGVRIFTYSLTEGDFHAANLRRGDGNLIFDLVAPHMVVKDISLGVPVEVNVENAIAAMGAVMLAGAFHQATARRAMATFQGARRRFEMRYREEGGGRVIIDDYAHHPDEVKASIRSVRALYPGRRLTVAFQPHLYSRTRDFAPAFAEALSQADDVVLLPIYPAREEPIPGVTSEIISERLTAPHLLLADKAEMPTAIVDRGFDVLLTLGAGDIVNFIPQVIEKVQHVEIL